ncbi:hypothetical protein BBJ28_00017930 [Nothophytophthora sp. Chile5]|nr:hypothetical protein BBJ28_00017930 [Nothophytophthora sp. Chile5]
MTTFQKELHSVEFRQEDITDPQLIALAEALAEMPIVSSLDLRDNRITDDGAKALLEVLRLQIIAAKTPLTIDPRTKRPLYPPLPDYTRYVTHVNLKGNEVSESVLQELSQYMDILRREDKRLEIRAALGRIDRNSTGGIDDDEFKGVIKLLTTSTPTKKEVQMFMQQHTLSTDSAQNAVNLENVLLARCATSPSRKTASPPWEALVQERHADLGASRWNMAAMADASSPTGSPNSSFPSRPSLPAPAVGSTMAPFVHSHSNPDISPPTTPSSQGFPVVPIDASTALNAGLKPPPAPISQPSAASQVQYPTKPPDLKVVTPVPHQPTAFTKPPSIPVLPLASMTQAPVYASQRVALPTVEDEGQRHPPVAREASSPIVSAASSPRYSDMSDSVSVMSSVIGGVASQRQPEEHERVLVPERKPPPPVAADVTPAIHDSPRWQSESLSVENEERASTGDFGATRAEDDSSSADEADNEVASGYSHGDGTNLAPKSSFTSGSSGNDSNDSKNAVSLPRREASNLGSEPVELSIGGGEAPPAATIDEKRSQAGSVVPTPRCEDLSSLVYRGTEDGGHLAPTGLSGKAEAQETTDSQPEEDEEVGERIDSVVVDVVKDGKERSIVKLIHSDFRSGLSPKEFPADLPLRNLLALLLSDNNLVDLALFNECRFPFVVVLDLSHNKLSKLPDDALAPFPRLEVLDLAHNRLKTISGVVKTFKLRALNLSHNAIRTVKNVEHLVQLEVLQLAANGVANTHALRLLSLNKMLTHLNLDGNPVVETDERQKRKNLVHVRNLLPMLVSLGSIQCAGLHCKEKKKANNGSTLGQALFESDELKALWVATACEVLQISQDAATAPQSSSLSQHDQGEWDSRDEDGDAERLRKPLNRGQQRQKDEIRSRAIGFRSRGKAPPSPPKVKTSVFSFGPPQPPLQKRKKKRPVVHADPSVVQEQQRRASQLSAPKHPPIDKAMMQQEQKRKSRVDYHANLTVGERLQLAREMTQRRPSSTGGATTRSSSMIVGGKQRKRSTAVLTAAEEEKEGEDTPAAAVSRLASPPHPSPIKDAVVFRIDPVDTPRSPKSVLAFRVDPLPVDEGGQTGNPLPTDSKEATFLHSLAVSDFLTHAEEELSTALTALNVLLAMSEKEPSDRKKLTDYRSSLEALDILNERESHELYERTQGHPDHDQQAECVEAFGKLGAVKKCMRQLLEKLETHAPGSGVIRAFCRFIRSNELRGIISTILEPQEAELSMPSATEDGGEEANNDDAIDQIGDDNALKQEERTVNGGSEQLPNQDPFVETEEAISEACGLGSVVNDADLAADDQDFDFLEPSGLALDGNEVSNATEAEDAPLSSGVSASASVAFETPSELASPDPGLYATTTDITMDIQMDDTGSAVESDEQGDRHTEDAQWESEVVESKQDALETADWDGTEEEAAQETYEEREDVPEEAHGALEAYEGATDAQDDADRQKDDHFDTSSPAEFTSSQHEDEDWLTSATELEPDANEDGQSFEQQMAAVSEDGEAEGEADQQEEEKEAGEEATEHYDWTSGSAADPSLEEGAVTSEEPWESEGPADEETIESGVTEEQQDYSEDATEAEAAGGEAEADEAQAALEEGEDADDEEVETFGDWEKGFDPNSNHYFWFNHNSGESSWTPPEGWPFELDDPFGGDGEAAAGEEQQEDGVEEQKYEETGVEEEQQAEQEDAAVHSDAGSASPRHSNGSDFEFDDSDLPSF